MDIQSTVVPSETDDQESAVERDVLGSQLSVKQEQEDAAQRYQIIDEHASYPGLHASIPSRRHLGEPPTMVSERIHVDGSSANGTLAVPISLYPHTPIPPRTFTMAQEPHSNRDCSFTDEVGSSSTRTHRDDIDYINPGRGDAHTGACETPPTFLLYLWLDDRPSHL